MRLRAFHWGLAWVLAALVLAAHLLGATAFVRSMWATHAYAFFPRPVLWIAAACLVAGIAAAARGWPWVCRAAALVARWGNLGPPAARMLAASLASFALFWVFRERHTFLGDGTTLTENLPLGQRFHPDEPLTLLIHHLFYRLTHGFFEAAGRLPADVARETVGLSSALAGALFVPVAWAVARDVASARTREEDVEGRESLLAFLLFMVVSAQGYIQLFFGYVENYTFYLLALATYVLAAFRYLAGRAPLLLPGLLLLLAIALHLSGSVLLPSFGVLVVAGLARRGGRLKALRDLAAIAGLFTAVWLALGRITPGYDLIGRLVGLGHAATHPASQGFSAANPAEFLNQQALIGPLGLFLLLPVAGAALGGRAWREARVHFLLVLGAGYLIASLIAGPGNLGMARNWDLLAPAGFVFTLAGLTLALRAPWPLDDLRRWLLMLACLSLFHTVPWVALNASFDRAFERLKILPLGQGRAESTVGYWYLTRGREQEAADWFVRSLQINPNNNIAAFNLGVIAMRHQDYGTAIQAFGSAVQARPTMQSYRLALVDALVRTGELPYARTQLDTLLVQNPGEPTYWAASSIVWLGLGKPDSSLAAVREADRLAPGEPRLGRLERHLERGLSPALRDDWTELMKHWER